MKYATWEVAGHTQPHGTSQDSYLNHDNPLKYDGTVAGSDISKCQYMYMYMNNKQHVNEEKKMEKYKY